MSQSNPPPKNDPSPAAATHVPPVDKFRDGPIHVSIWQNKGPKGEFRTASFEMRYLDNAQQWQTGRNYSSSALLHLESAAREARARIEKWQQTLTKPAAPNP